MAMAHGMTKLLSFAPILLTTRSKCVSEDSKKTKKIFRFFVQEIFFPLKSPETYAKKSIKMGAKRNIFLGRLRPPAHEELRLPQPTGDFAHRPRILLDSIPLANWLSGITCQRFYKSGSQKSLYISLQMLSTKSTISQKIKIIKIVFSQVSSHCASFWTKN